MRFPVSAVAAVAAAFFGASTAAAQAGRPDEEILRLKLAQAKDALEKAQAEAAQLKFHKPEERKPESSDATLAAIKKLAASKDPKTAALARELLMQLSRSTTPHGIPMTFKVSPEGGILELRLGDEKHDKPRTPEKPKPGGPHKTTGEGAKFQLRFDGDKPKPMAKPGSGFQFQIEGIKPKPGTRLDKPQGLRVVTEKEAVVIGGQKQSAGHSTLRISADGKTAAVVSADGTVTIFDVASGKELMSFPGKK